MKNKVYLHTYMCIMHELAALYIAQYTYVAMCRHAYETGDVTRVTMHMKGECDIALLFHKSFIHVRCTIALHTMHPDWMSILILGVGITVCYFAS